MSRRDRRSDNYRPGPPGKTSAPIPKAAPQEVPAPQAAEVVLPEPTDALTALKRRSHRPEGEAPQTFDGGFQP